MDHAFFLKYALEKARLGRGKCAPNPSVGAVVVQENAVLSEGWHEGPGTPHAERMALSRLPVQCSDLTLYVTLEPCNHWGRTPPCVEAIIDHGIKRVVYGFKDPNPIVVRNQTPVLLQQQGIEVIFHPIPEIEAFYQSYVYWLQTQRPWVSVKAAQTLDGMIARTHGKPTPISNLACAHLTHQMRSYSDALLTTSKTILADQAQFTVRLDGRVTSKPLAILDRTLCLPADASIFKNLKHAYVFYDQALPTPSPRVNCEFVGIATRAERLVLEDILIFLGEQGVHDLWVEGGTELFTSLHQEALVHRTFLYVSPVLFGKEAYSLYPDKTIFQRQHSVSWRVLEDNAVLEIHWVNASGMARGENVS